MTRVTLGKCPPDQIRTRAVLITDLIKIYTILKQYILAQSYTRKLVPLVTAGNLPNINAENAYSALTGLYLKTHQLVDADKYLNEYREINKVNQNLLSFIKVEQFAFQLDSNRGNYLSAIKYYQRYKFLGDSLSGRNHNKQVSQLEIEYELEKKDQDIALKSKNSGLVTPQTLLQEYALTSQNWLVTCFLVGWDYFYYCED